MGRASPEQKRTKRRRQKAKRKLFPEKTPVEKSSNEAEDFDGSDNGSTSDVEITTVGDVDMDVIDMNLYDSYRQLDGKEYPTTYLLKCREKLVDKVKKCRKRIHVLEEELSQTKLDSVKEKERIRKFYEMIAFGQSHAGRLVRSARGKCSAAGEIVEDLKEMYSVDSENYYA